MCCSIHSDTPVASEFNRNGRSVDENVTARTLWLLGFPILLTIIYQFSDKLSTISAKKLVMDFIVGIIDYAGRSALPPIVDD